MLLVFKIIEVFFKLPDPNFGGWMPDLSAQFSLGVGHIVAAALQTKGIIDQAKILENLTELNSIASLFYLFAVAMAVGSVAIFGNYRQGIYLLVGPVFYTFMVTTTVSTDGVKAQMGEYEIPNSIGRQTKFLQHIKVIDTKGGTRKVSLAYALVDGIATEVIEEITKLLVNTKNRDHLRFVARERALSFLLLEVPNEQGLPLLVSRHQAECVQAMRNYMQSGVDTKKNLNEDSIARSDSDVSKIKAQGDMGWKDMFKIKFSTGADVQIKKYLLGMKASVNLQNLNIADEKEDLVATCKDVWQWIGAIYQARAQSALNVTYIEGRDGEERIDPDVIPDVQNAISKNYLAAHMYKNTLAQSSNSQLQAQMFSNSPINAEDLSTVFRHNPGAHARGGYFQMNYFAHTIPYIQGLLLYILSIGFPFFAILLVVPGKAMNFMIWVSLWVWVKSWDVGFALVLVCKNMFWEILKHRNNTFDNADVDWTEPSAVFSVILNNDPLATQNLYHELSCFLTVSVPFLTAHFCLGATGMFEMFRNSIDQTSQRFRTWETKSGLRERLNITEREHPQLAAGTSEMFANRTLNQESTGTVGSGPGRKFISGRGAQDSRGRALGQDTPGALMSGSNVGKLTGVSVHSAMMGYNYGDYLTRVGNDDLLAQTKKERRLIDAFESRVNANLPENAPTYEMPAAFSHVGPTKDPEKTTLDQNVPAGVLKEYSEKNQGKIAIDVNQEITWGKFIEADANSKGQRVVLPHAFRGMPSLESSVSIEELRKWGSSVGTLEMVPAGSKVKELVAKAEEAEVLKGQLQSLMEKGNKTEDDTKKIEKIEQKLSGLGEFTLESVARASHQDFISLVNYTGAMSTRHFIPQIQAGLPSAVESLKLGSEISQKARQFETGSGSDENQEILANPVISGFLKMISGVDSEDGKPGVP